METYNLINSATDKKSLDAIMFELYNAGIKRTYDIDENRFILSPVSRDIKSLHGTHRCLSECNGYIFETLTKRPLCVPLPVMTTNVDTRYVNDHIDNYDVFYALDGTTINLYFWQNSWRISTAKGYDVSDLRWNYKTHREMLDDVLSSSGVNPLDFYELLNNDFSYTFVIKHPDLHLYWEDGEPIKSIYFIQCVNLNSLEREIELPNGLKNLECIREQKKYECHNVRSLYPIVSGALILPNAHHLYGFVIRAKDFSSHIILPTKLLKNIKMLVYDNKLVNDIYDTKEERKKPFKNIRRKKTYEITNEEKEKLRAIPWDEHIFLSSVLHDGKRLTFLTLFPQYSEKYKMVYNKVMELSIEVEKIYRGERNENENENENARYIFNRMSELISHNQDIIKHIHKFIMNPNNISIVYSLYE